MDGVSAIANSRKSEKPEFTHDFYRRLEKMTIKTVVSRTKREKSDRKIKTEFKKKQTKSTVRKLSPSEMNLLIAESFIDAILAHGHSFFPKEYLKK